MPGCRQASGRQGKEAGRQGRFRCSHRKTKTRTSKGSGVLHRQRDVEMKVISQIPKERWGRRNPTGVLAHLSPWSGTDTLSFRQKYRWYDLLLLFRKFPLSCRDGIYILSCFPKLTHTHSHIRTDGYIDPPNVASVFRGKISRKLFHCFALKTSCHRA